jgi:YHS domain-containing protein
MRKTSKDVRVNPYFLEYWTMKPRFFTAGVTAVLVLSAYCWAEIDLKKAKCMFSGKECSAEAVSEYNGGKVHFCCKKCVAEFEKDKAKHAAKANLHLTVTGQAKQIKCPLSGGPLNTEKKVELQGTEVCFCCEKCQGKVSDAADADKLGLVFGDKPFAKGFKVGE